MYKTVKVKIVHKCRVHDKHQKPGSIVEVTEEDAQVLVGLKRATYDLDAKVDSSEAEEKKKK